MPWKVVTRHGKNMTLAEAVDSILKQRESEAKELERRDIEREEIEKKRKEYYEAHMKEEKERLNKLVDWYKFKLDKIREAPVDSRPRKLEKLYRYSEANKDSGVTITRAGTINLADYPSYPPELKLHEYEDNEEDVFYDAPKPGSLPAGCKPPNQLDYFQKTIRAYQGRDEDAVKYVKKVKAIMHKPLNEMELKHVRLAMVKVKCPRKLDISVFYELTRRLPRKDLNYDDERLLIHFYDTFYNKSINLLRRTVKCRVKCFISFTG